MPFFQPPHADHLPPTVPGIPGNHSSAYLLLRHFKNRASGRTVLKVGGVYSTVEYPTQDQLNLATEVYLGGHVYEVSQSVADALEAAGFETTTGAVETWGAAAAFTWAEFAAHQSSWDGN